MEHLKACNFISFPQRMMAFPEIHYNMGQSLKFLRQLKIQLHEMDKSGQVLKNYFVKLFFPHFNKRNALCES